MTPAEALDRIAALCADAAVGWSYGENTLIPTVRITDVRAVLAEVTPGTGDMPSPVTDPGDMQSSGPESYKSGGVLDRDQARAVAGVALTPEDVPRVVYALRNQDHTSEADWQLAARLEAAS